MANEAIIGHLGLPQMAVSHLRPAAIWDFYNVNCIIHSLFQAYCKNCEIFWDIPPCLFTFR